MNEQPTKCEQGSESPIASLRELPSVRELVDLTIASDVVNGTAPRIVRDLARAVLDEHRAAIHSGLGLERGVTRAMLVERVVARLARRTVGLAPVINATGILLHTGLGRAPMAPSVVAAVAAAAGGYVPVELDLASGQRGRRTAHVVDALCALTGAPAATVVNNCAAALMITLRALADGRDVIVSRGELVEIGGSFRLPEIMAAAGVHLREVGTTNRTRHADYEQALDDRTALLMKVHASNYRIEGFTEEASIAELVALGRAKGVPVVHDTGSGALTATDTYHPSAEPAAAASIEAGADLVLFSGDKLLGGPQAGIIVGRADLVGAIDRHPMMRALRVDKLRIAALSATLELHRDPAAAAESVPALAMCSAPLHELRARAEAIVAHLDRTPGVTLSIEDATGYLGGGSIPAVSVPSVAVVASPDAISEHELARRLRTGRPAVVARVSRGAVWFDIRSIMSSQDRDIVRALHDALAGTT